LPHKRASAQFLVEILGLPEPTTYGPFVVVQVDNELSLDFLEDEDEDVVRPQHYAFLVGEAEFDQIYGRILERGLPYWADPSHQRPQEVNTNDGGEEVSIGTTPMDTFSRSSLCRTGVDPTVRRGSRR